MKTKNRNALVISGPWTVMRIFSILPVFLIPVSGAATTEGLEEVIVTAQRISQSVQDIGIATGVIGENDIRELRIQMPVDITGQIPNFTVKEISPGTAPVFTIRGVGLNDFSANNNPTVGIYVDEAFLTSTSQLAQQLYDMERIEVLKGPQGTLYGRNSTAGAINFITAKPKFENQFSASAAYANYETADIDLMVNRVVSDELAIRVAGQKIRQDEGYWTSRTVNGETIGERDIWSARMQLLWAPTDETSVNLKLEAGGSDSELGPFSHFGTFSAPFSFTPCDPVSEGRMDPNQCVDLHGYSDTDDDPFTGDWNNDSESRYDQSSAVLNITTSFGGFNLTSITAYQAYERSHLSDVDAGPLPQAEFNVNDEVDQLTQEFRLVGALSDNVDIVTGLFYSYDEVVSSTPSDLSSAFFTRALIRGDQETRSAALFGNINWHLSDTLTLILGGRYTWEEKEFFGGTTDLNPLGSSCLLSVTCTPGLTGPVALSFIDETIDDTNFSWKIGLDYIAAEDILLYGSISKAYKSGGFYGGSAFTVSNTQLIPFDREELISYELGVKSRVLSNTLQLNASAFYYDYTDVQTFTAQDGPVIQLALTNVADSRIYGFEFDAWFQPTQGLDINMTLGYLDAELGGFNAFSGGVSTPIAKGNKFPDAPELTFSSSFRYEWQTNSELIFSVATDVSYTDEVFKESVNLALLSADDYWLWNAQIGIRNQNDTWQVSFWGKNLSDEQGLSHAYDAGFGSGGLVYTAPRTYGVTLSYSAL